MKLVAFTFFLMISYCGYSQRINTSGKKDSAYFNNIKVKIENFTLAPPGCGIMKFVSVYKATLEQPQYSLGVKEILIFAECREAFGNVYSGGNIYYINFRLFKPDVESASIVNFSGVNIDSMKIYPKAKLFKIWPLIK
jgi:hypothetical protein